MAKLLKDLKEIKELVEAFNNERDNDKVTCKVCSECGRHIPDTMTTCGWCKGDDE